MTLDLMSKRLHTNWLQDLFEARRYLVWRASTFLKVANDSPAIVLPMAMAFYRIIAWWQAPYPLIPLLLPGGTETSSRKLKKERLSIFQEKKSTSTAARRQTLGDDFWQRSGTTGINNRTINITPRTDNDIQKWKRTAGHYSCHRQRATRRRIRRIGRRRGCVQKY